MLKRYGKAFVVAAVIFLSLDVMANEIRFTGIDMASGLSHNSALSVIQDHNGFVWIGTRDGLNRFDGSDFQIYKRVFNDSTSISNNQVNTIYESPDYTLWVGTADGLNRYDHRTNRFTRVKLPDVSGESNPQYIWSVLETGDQTLLAGTSRGLYAINKKSGEVNHFLVNPNPADHSNAIICIYADRNDRIWIGTRNGMYRFAGNQFIRYYIDPALEQQETRFEIRDIQENSDGALWIGTEAYGIAELSSLNDSLQLEFWMNSSNSQLISNTVRKIFFQTPHEVWIGTLNGLSICNTETRELTNYSYSPDHPGGINNYSIRDIYKDRQGGIWLASYAGGINYYHPENNQFIRRSYLMSRNGIKKIQAVTSLIDDKQGNLWIGTEADGLFQCDIRTDSLIRSFNTSNSNIVSDNIKSIVADDHGNLWIGTFNGLSFLDLKNNTFKNFTSHRDDNSALKNNQVHTLLYEEGGILWIGTNGGGVQLYDPAAGQFQSVKGLENQNVNTMFKDSGNRLWIGTQSDIFVLSENGRELMDLNYLGGELLSQANYVSFITEDHDRNVWIGTQWNGLFLIRDHEVRWFTTDNGLTDNTVNAMLEGANNQFWITTNKGLARITYYEDSDGVSSIESRSFSVNQGLQGYQFYPRSALKHASGVLYFGGINGFNKFEPGKISGFNTNPVTVFTEFRLKYRKVTPHDEQSPLPMDINETDHITLGYDQRDFSIFFKGINYSNPDHIFYRYKVENLDDVWIDLGNQRLINFTYFPVGTHEIKIQASTNPDYWEESFRSLKITITPPWWKTRWAFILYAMLIFMLLMLFFMVSQKWAQIKNQLEMEHFQREKENELHQLKLKFFTDVSHELRTPLTLILAPLENLIMKSDFPNRFRNQLIQIQQSGYRMMQLVNQILDLRKLETGHERLSVANGNIIRFFTEISLAFKEIAISRSLTFEFNPHTRELNMWFDRDKLEIIFNNLLSNAFKFSFQNGKVQLNTREVTAAELPKENLPNHPSGNYLEIRVINEGEEISSDDLQQIYNRFYSKNGSAGLTSSNFGVGLELTKRMVELHRGFIKAECFKNLTGTGSQIVFSVFLPMEREQYAEDEIDLTFKNSEDPSLYRHELLKSELMVPSDEEKFKMETLHKNNGIEKILVVEDNSEVRRFVMELFHEKYRVDGAENGFDGFNKAVEESPDLIISDVMMPEMDGIELCKRIKTDPRTSHIPVILLTARTAVTFKYEGLETGADEYITKPFSAQYLLLRVSNLINQRNALREHFKREALCDPGSVTVTSIDEKLLIEAVKSITENIANANISVSSLSEHLGLSRVHFYRKIKSLTGMTAVEFIRSVRLKRAAFLLEQAKFSVKEVQHMTGFDDADYFRKCFQKQFGVNPSQYKDYSV